MSPPPPFRPRVGASAPVGFHDQVLSALRAEIQEQGALLGLFEEQQRAIIQRDSARVLSLIIAIQKQVETAITVRNRREIMMGQALRRARISPKTPLTALLPQFPVPKQPLLRALIEEVVRVAERVRSKANQNQMLLARSIDLIREFLDEISPQLGGKIYDEEGALKIKLSGTGTAYIR